MARFGDEPDGEFYGVSQGIRGKALLFQGDYWEEEQFVPLSQCDFVPDPDSDEPGRGTLFVRAWLVKKNGWK